MASLARSLSTRVAKRIEKPKPLKPLIQNRHSFSDKELLQHSGSDVIEIKPPDTPVRTAEDVLVLLDLVSSNILNKEYSNIMTLTNNLVNRLKSYGSTLEEYHEEKLDKAFEVLRTGAHDITLDKQTRLNLLQIVELRAAQWQMPPGYFSYYSSRSCFNNETSEICGDILFDSNLQLLGPGDVLKSSGKYSSPTRVPGKNYCKDEVVIRNSDSGKVMGIKGRRVHMIEELSETVISFQRVNPGAKERLVQITGPSEDKIIYAKNLIEDTIKRNASPVREMGIGVGTCEVAGSNSSINSSASDESNRLLTSSGRSTFISTPKDSTEFKYSVHVLNDVIHISSTNLNLLNEAFSLLDSSYAAPEEIHSSSPQNSRCVPNTSLNFQIGGHVPDFYPNPVETGEENNSESDKTSEDSQDSTQNTTQNSGGFLRQYSRQFLLDCSSTKSALMIPPNWSTIAEMYPAIIRQSPSLFDPAAYQKRWLETDGKIIAPLTHGDDYLDSD